MVYTASVSDFKQNIMALIDSALESNQDIRVTTLNGSALFSTNKISPELMSDQEYIETDPSWVKELMESKDTKRDYVKRNWRK